MPVHQNSLAGSGAKSALATPDVLYLCCSVLLVGAVAFVHLFAPVNIVSYERDVWHHMAVLNDLMRSPFHPSNPHVISDAPSRSFMPWYLMLALLGRGTNLDAQQLLGISAALSTVALMVGVRLFASAYFESKWGPLMLLGVMVGAWSTVINHTGFPTLATLFYSASYPFTIVLALGFVAWWIVLQVLQTPRVTLTADLALALLTAFMFTTHQLQGAFAIGGMLVFALFYGDAPLLRRCRVPAGVIAGLVLCHFWPYFDPIAYSFGSENYTFAYKTDIDWTSVPGLLGILWLPMIGLAGLYDHRRRRWRRDLVIGTIAILAGILAARSMGLWIGLRFLPFLVLFLQIALAAWLLDVLSMDRVGRARDLRKVIGTALAVAILSNTGISLRYVAAAELYLSGRSELHGADWSRDILDSMAHVAALVGPGKVVLAEGNTAFPVQASDMKVVSIPRPFPEVPDSLERQSASAVFFANDTSTAERCAILMRYHVVAVLYRPSRVPSRAQQAIEMLGTPVLIHDLTLVRLPESKPTPCSKVGPSQP